VDVVKVCNGEVAGKMGYPDGTEVFDWERRGETRKEEVGGCELLVEVG
jgi:hypothetical protein